MYWLLVILLAVLDLAALIGMLVLSLKIRAFKIPTFFRGALGAVAAIPLEIVRIFAGIGLTRWLGVTQADELLLLLLNLRMFNIPLLIGGGFLGAAFAEVGMETGAGPKRQGGAAATQPESVVRVPCKKCGKEILREFAERQDGMCRNCQRHLAPAERKG